MLLQVSPDLDPVPGQFVIVRREQEKEAVFKRYVVLDGEPYLEAINPDWPTHYLKMQEGDVFCGVVVDASFGNLP
jgi:SOS-response transcriptional repressor LexA